MEKLQIVRFAPKGKNSFYDAVVSRVQVYFEQNRLSPYADARMWLKTMIMLALYFTPYLCVVLGYGAANLWLFFSFWVLIKSTAIEFGLPYHLQPTFLKALLEHAKMLKKIGEG